MSIWFMVEHLDFSITGHKATRDRDYTTGKVKDQPSWKLLGRRSVYVEAGTYAEAQTAARAAFDADEEATR